jgi:IMP dehydrogenase
MLTSKDLQFCRDHSLHVSQVMTPRSKMVVGKRGMNKQAAYDLMYDKRIESLPVPNGDGTHGLFLFDDLRRIFEEKGSIANVDQNDRLRTAAAVGTGPEEIARAQELLRGGVDVIVVETAHIHTKYGKETIMEVLRLAEGKADVVAGNISNPVSAVALGKWGVQGIKIGQGPGSICTTRVKAGIGAPQAWAVAACAQALRESNLGHIPVCADGGIVNPGDVTVAIGLGAESVMIGSLFAGTDETPGETYYDAQGKQVKKYRGMGSKAALMKPGSANRYAQGHLEASERISEGIESEVPYKGPLSLVFNELRGGLGQGMFYTGCRTIDELRRFSFPYIASSEAVREASPHDVKVTNAA